MAGMRATFPVGTPGAALDALVRAPLWAEGLDYNHGTGHGVGVNVHEFPPRVNPGSRTPLEVGQVFSIEPGVYIEGVGGVRIENLCTVRPDDAHEGSWRVEPLTFSPLDMSLVDPSLLTESERAFLSGYAATWAARSER